MNPETIVLAAILLAAGVGLARALHLDARWRRERDAVDAAKAEAAAQLTLMSDTWDKDDYPEAAASARSLRNWVETAQFGDDYDRDVAAQRVGAAQERKAIVEWLRTTAEDDAGNAYNLERLADEIRSDKHLRAGK